LAALAFCRQIPLIAATDDSFEPRPHLAQFRLRDLRFANRRFKPVRSPANGVSFFHAAEQPDVPSR